ncbi:MAG TPA: hypothetical protein DEB10_11560 [Ruminococcaceae bacterium]|nr:hypothetical protein [Oscillospiraceae bacterium]HCA29631.1 hypothetical protein [Oscillospiraceae bacterium]
MRNDITSIPISEVFEPRDGCPICRLRNTLEDRVVDYITGAAMMEPDVRQETNRLGFCYEHFEMMMKKRNRLGVALIMESHLEEIEKQIFNGLPLIGKSSIKQAKSAGQALCTCFVCKQIDWAMERMLATVCRLWENERDFRKLFDEQPALCLPHFSLLTEAAEKNMGKKNLPDFTNSASKLCKAYLTELRRDVSHFCRMFDYRNGGNNADWGNSRDSIERGVWWLTSRIPK